MKWFEGGIPAAIQAAKANKAVFIVLVTDEKEASAAMEAHLHQQDVTGMCEGGNCVAVRLMGDSNDCKFFSQIYPVVVIPSTFFIAHSGVPLEVVGEVATHDDFVAKVKAALDMQEKIAAEQASITSSSAQGATPSNGAGTSAEPDEKKQKVDDVPLDDKVERAKELVELTQQRKAKKEDDEEKQREFERRQIGQGVQKLRERQKEQDIRDAAKEFRKDKEADRLAREKVKEDIARDRAEKAERHSKQKEERSLAQEEDRKRKLEQQATQQTEQARRSDEARLQFRKPDGSSITHTFPATDTFASVHTFITQHMGCTVTLSTTFPRRTFTPADHNSTLQELELAPSSAILVMMGSGSSNVVRSSNDASSRVYSLLTLLFSPLVYVWSTLSNMLGLSGNPAPTNQSSSAGRSTKSEPPQATGGERSQGNAHRRQGAAATSRQEGNIRRFHNNEDDPDDESNTWNGNSTQQM